MKTTGIRQHKFSAHIPKLLETESVIIFFSINHQKKKNTLKLWKESIRNKTYSSVLPQLKKKKKCSVPLIELFGRYVSCIYWSTEIRGSF